MWSRGCTPAFSGPSQLPLDDTELFRADLHDVTTGYAMTVNVNQAG